MINTPTVLVLGAGASMCFGHPSGPGLKHDILSPISPSHRILNMQLDFTDEDLNVFIANLSTSGRTSVDAFLEYRPDLIDIGKSEIAMSLIRHENDSSLLLFHAENNW